VSRGKPQQGFSAIELVIVVAIILLVAAIALPQLFGARRQANEASAVASIKAIQTAESIYQNTYPANGYSSSLNNLGSNGSTCETLSPTNACILDPVLASGIKDAYLFDLLGDGNIPDQAYTVTATPLSPSDGACTYSSDQSGLIRSGAPAPSSAFSGSATPGGASCGTN
jgi:type IV pilus assembly protein PilA